MANKCKYCGRIIGDKNYKKHINKCMKLYEQFDKIKYDYEVNKLSYYNLGKKYNCSELYISNFLQYNGVKRLMDYYVNHTFFDSLDNKYQFWLLGLFASDGNVHNDIISISQSGKFGKHIMNYVIKLLDYKSSLSVGKTYRQDYYRINFKSNNILTIFKQFNILPNKSVKYDLPNNIPKDMLKYFIRGFVEGDGSITIQHNKNNNYYLSFSLVGTPSCMLKIKNYLEEQIKGLKLQLFSKRNSNVIQEIRINGEYAIKLCEYLYSDIDLYLGRKYYMYKKGQYLFSNSETTKYRKIKQEIKNVYLQNKKEFTYSYVLELSSKYNIAFQTIYKWKNKWDKGE